MDHHQSEAAFTVPTNLWFSVLTGYGQSRAASLGIKLTFLDGIHVGGVAQSLHKVSRNGKPIGLPVGKKIII